MVFPENEQGRREKSDLRRSQWSVGRQQRWVYLFKTGLISKEQADTWAEEVRPSNQDEVEIEGMRPLRGGLTMGTLAFLAVCNNPHPAASTARGSH
jgi:hypothetical protein